MDDEFEMIWKEMDVVLSTYNLGMCLEVLRKIVKLSV
jgi:hypothetical protein